MLISRGGIMYGNVEAGGWEAVIGTLAELRERCCEYHGLAEPSLDLFCCCAEEGSGVCEGVLKLYTFF